MKDNPSLQHYPEIMAFLKTTHPDLKINYLGFGRIYRDGRHYAITTNPSWMHEHVIVNKWVPVGLLNFNKISGKHLSFANDNSIGFSDWSEEAYRYAKERFQIKNILASSIKREDYLDQYLIDLQNDNAVELLFNKLPEVENIVKNVAFQFRDLIQKVAKQPIIYQAESPQQDLLPLSVTSKKHHVLYSGPDQVKVTARQFSILELLSRGMQYKMIAATLAISTKTVETHLAHLKNKLKLSSANELVYCYWDNQEFNLDLNE